MGRRYRRLSRRRLAIRRLSRSPACVLTADRTRRPAAAVLRGRLNPVTGTTERLQVVQVVRVPAVSQPDDVIGVQPDAVLPAAPADDARVPVPSMDGRLNPFPLFRPARTACSCSHSELPVHLGPVGPHPPQGSCFSRCESPASCSSSHRETDGPLHTSAPPRNWQTLGGFGEHSRQQNGRPVGRPLYSPAGSSRRRQLLAAPRRPLSLPS